MNRRHPRKRGTVQKTQIKWDKFWGDMARAKDKKLNSPLDEVSGPKVGDLEQK